MNSASSTLLNSFRKQTSSSKVVIVGPLDKQDNKTDNSNLDDAEQKCNLMNDTTMTQVIYPRIHGEQQICVYCNVKNCHKYSTSTCAGSANNNSTKSASICMKVTPCSESRIFKCDNKQQTSYNVLTGSRWSNTVITCHHHHKEEFDKSNMFKLVPMMLFITLVTSSYITVEIGASFIASGVIQQSTTTTPAISTKSLLTTPSSTDINRQSESRFRIENSKIKHNDEQTINKIILEKFTSGRLILENHQLFKVPSMLGLSIELDNRISTEKNNTKVGDSLLGPLKQLKLV